MVIVLNTKKVYSNLTEQYWYKERIMIARWSETLMEITGTLLEKERREFTVSAWEEIRGRGQ